MILTVLKKSTLFVFFLLFINSAFSQNGQITVNSSGGNNYSVTLKIVPRQIITSSTSCLYGYNYNVRFDYFITYSGTPPQGGLNKFQIEIICLDNQINGYYSLPQNPSNSSGSAVTGTNPNVPNNGTAGQYSSPYVNCSHANIYTFNCLKANLIIQGPGIGNKKIPFNLGNPLPVELIDFNAEAEKNKVNLEWTTASERNSDYFTIERTTDGENFEIIGTVKAAGNSSTIKHYHFTDFAPIAGISYYRLSQTDFDGQSESFEIKSVDVKPTNRIITNVFPNPTQEARVNVLIQQTDQLVEVRLYSLLGQLIQQKTMDASQNQVIESMDLPEAPGTYLIELVQEGEIIGRHKVQVTR